MAWQWLDISIDLVPAIEFPSWLPPWCRPHPLLDRFGCLAVAKWIPEKPEATTLLQLGFCRCDAEMFHEMPRVMRDGYKLAKLVRHSSLCPRIEGMNVSDIITSYILKTCIFTEYEEWMNKSTNPPSEDDGGGTTDHSIHSNSQQDMSSEKYLRGVTYWAHRIYERLEGAFEEQNLESFYIRHYNLLRDGKYKQFKQHALAYTRLCKTFLTHETGSTTVSDAAN
jgi:hypothetical protein